MKTTSIRHLRRSAHSLIAVGIVGLYFVAASSLVGCSKDAPPPPPPAAPTPPPPPPPAPPAVTPAVITSVTLGKSVGSDKKISAPAETFGQKDTIYAAVETTGVGKGTAIKARWTFTSKKGSVVPVHEEVQTVDLNGPAAHEFHMSKKTPWPKGAYTVEIFLNDTPATKKTFSIN